MARISARVSWIHLRQQSLWSDRVSCVTNVSVVSVPLKVTSNQNICLTRWIEEGHYSKYRASSALVLVREWSIDVFEEKDWACCLGDTLDAVSRKAMVGAELRL